MRYIDDLLCLNNSLESTPATQKWLFTPEREIEDKAICADHADLENTRENFSRCKSSPGERGQGENAAQGGTAFHAPETFPKGEIPPHRRQEPGFHSAQPGRGFPRSITAI